MAEAYVDPSFYQSGYDPYAAAGQSAYNDGVYQSGYQGDSIGFESGVGTQGPQSTISSAPDASSSSSSMYCASIAVFCCVFLFCGFAIVLSLISRDVKNIDVGDNEESGDGGGGGSDGGGGGGPRIPVPYPPVVRVEDITSPSVIETTQPVTQVNPDPHQMSTAVSHDQPVMTASMPAPQQPMTPTTMEMLPVTPVPTPKLTPPRTPPARPSTTSRKTPSPTLPSTPTPTPSTTTTRRPQRTPSTRPPRTPRTRPPRLTRPPPRTPVRTPPRTPVPTPPRTPAPSTTSTPSSTTPRKLPPKPSRTPSTTTRRTPAPTTTTTRRTPAPTPRRTPTPTTTRTPSTTTRKTPAPTPRRTPTPTTTTTPYTTTRRTPAPTPRRTPTPTTTTTPSTTTPTTPTPTTRTTRPPTTTVTTTTTRPTTTTRTTTVPPSPPAAAKTMPPYTYVCTVVEPVRGNTAYLPPDKMCDYLFYDSLYKNGKNKLLEGIDKLELGVQYFIGQANKSATPFGMSFSPESPLLTADYRDPYFNLYIDVLWGYKISHFGFLDLYRQYTERAVVAGALNVLKTVYNFLKPKMSAARPSYYVVGLSVDGTPSDDILNLMKTVFTPSMFISIAHLSYSVRKFSDCRIFPVAMEALPPGLRRGRDYSYGHTVNESLAVLQRIQKLGFSFPFAIAVSLKGLYYSPKLADSSSPKDDEFKLFKPCQDFQTPPFGDPNSICKGNWISILSKATVRELAYNKGDKISITYLTETGMADLVCGAKVSHMQLEFGIAAYDVDYDQAAPCSKHGFGILGGSYNRIMATRTVMNFIRSKFTSPDKAFDCQVSVLGLSLFP